MQSCVAVSVLAAFAMGVGGCASVIEGRSQQISVSTNPPGAECGLYREEGARIASVQETPGRALVEKTKHDIWIVCVKPGYQQATYLNHSGVSGAVFVNVIGGIFTLGISTVIGAAVDSSNGSDNLYQSPVTIAMAENVAGAAEGPTVLPKKFMAARPAQTYSHQIASPDGVIATPGDAPAQRAPATTQTMAPITAVAASSSANENAWTARGTLIANRSISTCAKDIGPYSLYLTGSTFTVDTSEGRVLNAVVPPDGAINQPLATSRRGGLSVIGNVRSKDLELVDSSLGCRWRLA